MVISYFNFIPTTFFPTNFPFVQVRRISTVYLVYLNFKLVSNLINGILYNAAYYAYMIGFMSNHLKESR